LLALTARIRPHFLFNALNAVLGVIRSDPRRAETALEELADLFRVLMRENADLVPLSEEIQVARQYINLERLRLGERVRVVWDMAACPPDPLVPPLMLQPLLENAVYHGIEPATEPGEITIRFECRDSRLRVELSNPMAATDSHTHGNQMALNNIRERLMLFFDLDATLVTKADSGRFSVSIEFPYRPVADAMSGGLRLLLVDDEAPARARLRDLLGDIATEVPSIVVAEAADGRAALEQAQSGQSMWR
jgi:two-component system sensor histidine kinase AlgZ